MRSITPILSLFLAGAMYAQPDAQAPDVQTIVQRSVAANEADWNAAPEFAFLEDDRSGENDRTYEVMMILGSPYRRLIRVNGIALSPQAEQKEQRKLADAVRQRRSESQAARQARIGNYAAERKHDRLLMEQLTKAFDFTLSDNQKMTSRDVYVLQATPRNGYIPPNTEARVLRGMEGELWIDKLTFQWVKVMARVIHPVSIAGFLARVQPGTYFELEKMPVTKDIWLPKHFAMKSRARVLSLIGHKTQEDVTYSNYHKINPSSRSLSEP
jgi:hypothetical protein